MLQEACRRYFSGPSDDDHPEVLAYKAYMQYRHCYDYMTKIAFGQNTLRYPVRPKMHQLEHLQLACTSRMHVCPAQQSDHDLIAKDS